ncbi:MAG: hypothetical protein MRY21_07970 [Simkaniaceae bacterium]|nr:hypothetical protein [Simkaniaceae bacterium]
MSIDGIGNNSANNIQGANLRPPPQAITDIKNEMEAYMSSFTGGQDSILYGAIMSFCSNPKGELSGLEDTINSTLKQWEDAKGNISKIYSQYQNNPGTLGDMASSLNDDVQGFSTSTAVGTSGWLNSLLTAVQNYKPGDSIQPIEDMATAVENIGKAPTSSNLDYTKGDLYDYSYNAGHNYPSIPGVTSGGTFCIEGNLNFNPARGFQTTIMGIVNCYAWRNA